MFRRVSQFQKTVLSRHFATYYTFQDSVFNFALTVKAKNIIDGENFSETVNRIDQAYQKGVTNLFIRLKDSNDENDVENIVNKIKGLQQKYPNLNIQGVRYPMTFNQRTSEFLHNEFQFGLKAAQLITNKLYPLVFFHADYHGVFRSALNEESKASFEKALFNYDVLNESLKTLKFANLVLTLDYDPEFSSPENLKKFFDAFKNRNVGFDLELNRSFASGSKETKKKNTADFIKYAYGFEPLIKSVNLYDFKFDDGEAAPQAKNNENASGLAEPKTEDASSPKAPQEDAKGDKEKKSSNSTVRVPLGEGVIDFKLVFDMVKISNFQGALVLPGDITPAELDTVTGWAKQYEFAEKSEEDVLQYMAHKEKLKARLKGQGGLEYMPI